MYYNLRRSIILFPSTVVRRHAAERREYQVKYNQVKRLTRRKLGKAKLAALRDAKWQELNGIKP